MTRQARCKGCGRPIYWRYTPAEKNMPLDATAIGTPDPGAYVITSDQECRPAEPLLDPPGTEYHMNHWASCPNRETFRPKGHQQ